MSKQWAIIVIALIILFINVKATKALKTGLILAVVAYTLLGALIPEFFIPLGVIVIVWLIIHYRTEIFG